MASDVAEVMESARGLSREQRADLAYQLLLTLDEDVEVVDEEKVAAAWRSEIARRLEDYRGGNRNTISVEDSHAQIRASRTGTQR